MDAIPEEGGPQALVQPSWQQLRALGQAFAGQSQEGLGFLELVALECLGFFFKAGSAS